MQHLAAQWKDRQRYWELRERARRQRDILCLIVDSMDKSKFALPRWSDGRTPKSADKFRRPVLEVTACIVHGVGVYIYVADETMTTGASWTGEVLLQSIDSAFRCCQRAQRPMPSRVVVVADNTVKEVKNGVMSHFGSSLVCSGYFESFSHMHLRVGHTHEDVGWAQKSHKL